MRTVTTKFTVFLIAVFLVVTALRMNAACIFSEDDSEENIENFARMDDEQLNATFHFNFLLNLQIESIECIDFKQTLKNSIQYPLPLIDDFLMPPETRI